MRAAYSQGGKTFRFPLSCILSRQPARHNSRYASSPPLRFGPPGLSRVTRRSHGERILAPQNNAIGEVERIPSLPSYGSWWKGFFRTERIPTTFRVPQKRKKT